jgi:PAS domain S-box-containing protein
MMDNKPSYEELEVCLAELERQHQSAVLQIEAYKQDAAERKRAQEALEHYRILAEYGRDIILFVRRSDGRIIEANGAAQKAYGCTRDELLLSSIQDLRDPASLSLIESQMNEADSWGILFETAHRRKDGTVFPVEVSSIGVLLDGERVLLSIIRDITERKRAEAARFYLASIVESSGDAIIGKHLDGTITSWNPGAERIYGYSAEEVVGRPISILAPLHRAAEITDILERTQRGENVEPYETLRIRKDGQPIDISLTVSPIKDADGQIIGASSIARDITERKQLEGARERLVLELRDALAKVRTLSGLLPICAHCKKIRDDKGYWNQIEVYVSDHSEAEFSHGICPQCLERLYPEFSQKIPKDSKSD